MFVCIHKISSFIKWMRITSAFSFHPFRLFAVFLYEMRMKRKKIRIDEWVFSFSESRLRAQRMRFIGCITTCHVFAVGKKLSYFSFFIPDNVDWSDYLDRNYLNKSQFVNYEQKKTSKHKDIWCESPENQNARVVESVPTTEN